MYVQVRNRLHSLEAHMKLLLIYGSLTINDIRNNLILARLE